MGVGGDGGTGLSHRLSVDSKAGRSIRLADSDAMGPVGARHVPTV